MSRLAALVGLLASSCATAGPTRAPAGDAEAPAWRYTVAPDAALSRIDVEVCLDGPVPAELVPGVPGGALPLAPSGHDARGPFSVAVSEGGALRLAANRRDACVSYALDVGQLLAAGDREDAFRVGGDLVLAPDILLWRPRALPRSVRANLRFALPSGLAASTPWPRDADGAYLLDRTAFTWRGQLALGRFTVETLRIDARTRFDVVLLDRPTRTTAAGRRRWVRAAAGAVREVVGTFPRRRLQVLVAPTRTAAPASDPVRFGYVLRGGGAGVTLLLDAGADDAALGRDWVAFHELFHLTMPPIVHEDAWLSEGLTMYFTELLRARAGLIGVDEAFVALHDGFTRGRRDGTGRTLAEESRDMRETHAYRRVYWAGAAIALRVDLALRRRTGRGLDAAIARLSACCSNARRFWTAADTARQIDEFATIPEYTRAAERWLATSDFPALGRAYAALGLDPETGRPDRDAAHAALRHDLAVGATALDAPATSRVRGAPPTRP